MVILSPSAPAQEVIDRRAEPAVESTVIVEEAVVNEGKGAKDESGLTRGGRTESGGQRARRDAVDSLEVGTTLGMNYTPPTAAKTIVVVKGTVTQQGGRKSEACTQVGVIGTQAECRPPQ